MNFYILFDLLFWPYFIWYARLSCWNHNKLMGFEYFIFGFYGSRLQIYLWFLGENEYNSCTHIKILPKLTMSLLWSEIDLSRQIPFFTKFSDLVKRIQPNIVLNINHIFKLPFTTFQTFFFYFFFLQNCHFRFLSLCSRHHKTNKFQFILVAYAHWNMKFST